MGANAVWGGLVLMTDRWQLPTHSLRHSPFDDWFLPGLALIGWIVVQLAWLRIVHPGNAGHAVRRRAA